MNLQVSNQSNIHDVHVFQMPFYSVADPCRSYIFYLHHFGEVFRPQDLGLTTVLQFSEVTWVFFHQNLGRSEKTFPEKKTIPKNPIDQKRPTKIHLLWFSSKKTLMLRSHCGSTAADQTSPPMDHLQPSGHSALSMVDTTRHLQVEPGHRGVAKWMIYIVSPSCGSRWNRMLPCNRFAVYSLYY